MPFFHFEELIVLLLHRLFIGLLIFGKIVTGFFGGFFMLFANLLARMRFRLTIFVRNLMTLAGSKSNGKNQDYKKEVTHFVIQIFKKGLA